ncbi:MAG TPA: hypothetical protein DEQ50_05905 [Lactobacillus sp.]|nr:hypothetical protein [Lactobacillus sp.]
MKIKNALLAGVLILGFSSSTAVMTETITPAQEVKADVGQYFVMPKGSVVTVKYGLIASLYDINGNFTGNRLGASTSWQTDSGYRYNGYNYYRVSTDRYVREDNVDITK